MHESQIEHMRSSGLTGLYFTGFYFPPRWREFVFGKGDGTWWINLLHPNAQAALRLRVVLASKESDLPGFIGLQAVPHGLDEAEEPSFFISTSSGDLRRNANGDLLGDQLVCAYPRPKFDDVRLPSLNYPLPAPPYTAPPGTTEIVPSGEA
jgi:hypothetical protein